MRRNLSVPRISSTLRIAVEEHSIVLVLGPVTTTGKKSLLKRGYFLKDNTTGKPVVFVYPCQKEKFLVRWENN